jgi:hypothetical protein
MALAGADSKELGLSCLVVEICIILTRNQVLFSWCSLVLILNIPILCEARCLLYVLL